MIIFPRIGPLIVRDFSSLAKSGVSIATSVSLLGATSKLVSQTVQEDFALLYTKL